MNKAQKILALYEESETGYLGTKSSPSASKPNSVIHRMQLKFRVLRDKLASVRELVDKTKKNSTAYRKFEDALIELTNLGSDLAKQL